LFFAATAQMMRQCSAIFQIPAASQMSPILLIISHASLRGSQQKKAAKDLLNWPKSF